MTPSRRRPVVSYLHQTYRVSERRACRVARLAISTFRYHSLREPSTDPVAHDLLGALDEAQLEQHGGDHEDARRDAVARDGSLERAGQRVRDRRRNRRPHAVADDRANHQADGTANRRRIASRVAS